MELSNINEMKRILIGSPVRQNKSILYEFLTSLKELHKDGIKVDYCFVDDNTDEKSSNLLYKFKESEEGVYILDLKYGAIEKEYICTEDTHKWDRQLIKKVIYFKNKIIEFAIENKYDYLFFIDSDIVLDPKTLNQLISDDKDIISNIFWTKWKPNSIEFPQVWLQDDYKMHNFKSNEVVSQEEVDRKSSEFLECLRKPGVYKVGGLGACTLISRRVLLSGANFNDIYNLSFWGEDRYFCIRAVTLGFDLYVDTNYPAYHIYRLSELEGVKAYKENRDKRELEIFTLRLLDLVEKGINSLETYSYKDGFSSEFIKYFTDIESQRQINNFKEIKDYILENKIVRKTKVLKSKMNFYNHFRTIICDLQLEISGYRNCNSYYKESEAKCVIEQQEDGEFLINIFRMGREIESQNVHMTRHFKEIPTLTLSMVVKDEGDRYLREVLQHAKGYIDNAVIIDDGSTDNTVDICNEVLKGIPTKIIKNQKSKFKNEIDLRKQQWLETIKINPDWILFLDADEIFEEKCNYRIRDLMKDMDCDGYGFRLFDFWDKNHYRDDKLWCAHHVYKIFMIRYQKNFEYRFTETAQHCGRMPINVNNLSCKTSSLRIKHFGWAREKDRKNKYNRYMSLDKNGIYGSLEQYKSIMDKNPTLIKWNESE